MLSVSSSSSTPAFACPIEEAMYNYTLNHGFYDQEEQAAAEFIHLFEECAPGGDHVIKGGRNGEVKKLNHNASERQRRKKINELYASLRSLLPASQQSRRMSIPTTVARVLKYIPELQEEVEGLERKKKGMSKKINRVQEPDKSSPTDQHGQESVSSVSRVTTSEVGDREVVIQISAFQVFVSLILSRLEADGLLLLKASFETFNGRVFLSLHLQKQFGIKKMNCQELDENIRSMLEK